MKIVRRTTRSHLIVVPVQNQGRAEATQGSSPRDVGRPRPSYRFIGLGLLRVWNRRFGPMPVTCVHTKFTSRETLVSLAP